MQHLILALALFFSSILFAQTQQNKNQLQQGTSVKVSVVNVLNDVGMVKFAFFNEENFRKEPLFSKTAEIKKGISTVTFNNIPEGEYAIICYHDENSNGQLDFYENGMPIESYGTSSEEINFGPPHFENSKFSVQKTNLNLEIKF